MSHAPSTFMAASRRRAVADRGTISTTSSSIPGRLSAIDARHRPVAPNSLALAMVDENGARHLLGVGGDGVSEIAEHDVDLRDQLRHLGAQLLEMRRHEMDHALELDRELGERSGRARSQAGLKKLRGSFFAGPQRGSETILCATVMDIGSASPAAFCGQALAENGER